MRAFFLLVLFLIPCVAGASDSSPAFADANFRAEVLEVRSSGERTVPATRLTSRYQDLSVRIIEGPRTGEVLEVENDSPLTLAPGERFWLHRTPASDESPEMWAVGEPDRRFVLGGLLALFALVTVIVGGMSGVRALAALAGSFLLILFGLLPALSSGAPPAATAALFACAMLAFSMVVTHRFKRETFIAFLGSVAALAIAVALSEAAVALAHLSGFVSDEAVYLNFATDGLLDLKGLLLGGILVGVVGVLNDISVSQVHTVVEIRDANPDLTRGAVFAKAVRVGREHLGAVVNMLPLAYAGAALPLLLLFSTSDAPFLFVINREVFASEAIRILAGGIALSLSGAVATVLAAFALVRKA